MYVFEAGVQGNLLDDSGDVPMLKWDVRLGYAGVVLGNDRLEH